MAPPVTASPCFAAASFRSDQSAPPCALAVCCPGVDRDLAHPRQVDHQAALADGTTGHVVPASPHRDLQPVGRREPHGRGHVGRLDALGDHGRPPVDQPVVDAPRVLIVVIGALQHPPANPSAKASAARPRRPLVSWTSLTSLVVRHAPRARATPIVSGTSDADATRSSAVCAGMPGAGQTAADSTRRLHALASRHRDLRARPARLEAPRCSRSTARPRPPDRRLPGASGGGARPAVRHPSADAARADAPAGVRPTLRFFPTTRRSASPATVVATEPDVREIDSSTGERIRFRQFGRVDLRADRTPLTAARCTGWRGTAAGCSSRSPTRPAGRRQLRRRPLPARHGQGRRPGRPGRAAGARLQLRLQPVLRVRPALDVPAAAAATAGCGIAVTAGEHTFVP